MQLRLPMREFGWDDNSQEILGGSIFRTSREFDQVMRAFTDAMEYPHRSGGQVRVKSNLPEK